MKNYKNIITLSNNDRGIWDLDTSKGCSSGMAQGSNGCYDDCYAARSAKIYGIDFGTTILRYFKSRAHERQIVQKINKIDMPFIRIGCSGDPSENWDHTFSILEKIKNINKEIVIITKHWTIITDIQLETLKTYNVCVNTSVSALDKDEQRIKCIDQFKRLKPFCKSFLRIVSCDFNLKNEQGKKLSLIQEQLFKNDHIIDTVFRPSKNNRLVTENVINVKRVRFMKGLQFASKFNRKAYMGNCQSCIEKCGIFKDIARRKPIYEQGSLFIQKI